MNEDSFHGKLTIYFNVCFTETVSPSTPVSPSNFNTNNNASPEQLQSPDYTKRLLVTGIICSLQLIIMR